VPLYLYQAAYTSEAIAAQVKHPQDRLETAARPVLSAIGGRLVGGGYSFGEYDITIVYEAPDDTAAAALALAVGAGGAVRSAQTTRLLSGAEWVAALGKAGSIGAAYRPPS
jgi:uncharacterized protein with GYD domain